MPFRLLSNTNTALQTTAENEKTTDFFLETCLTSLFKFQVMTYPKLLKQCLASSSRKKYDLSLQSQLLFNVSQQPAVDEVSNIIFSRSSISMLVVLILSKNNFMIVPFFDFLVFQSTVK